MSEDRTQFDDPRGYFEYLKRRDAGVPMRLTWLKIAPWAASFVVLLVTYALAGIPVPYAVFFALMPSAILIPILASFWTFMIEIPGLVHRDFSNGSFQPLFSTTVPSAEIVADMRDWASRLCQRRAGGRRIFVTCTVLMILGCALSSVVIYLPIVFIFAPGLYFMWRFLLGAGLIRGMLPGRDRRVRSLMVGWVFLIVGIFVLLEVDFFAGMASDMGGSTLAALSWGGLSILTLIALYGIGEFQFRLLNRLMEKRRRGM